MKDNNIDDDILNGKLNETSGIFILKKSSNYAKALNYFTEPYKHFESVGDSETLTATVKPDNATDKTVTWTSDNESIATVDNQGKVTAVAAGEATITLSGGEDGSIITEDTWTVTDDTETTEADFSNLRDVLRSAGRPIEVVFPNIPSIPENALRSCEYLASVSAPMAKSIGKSALGGSMLKSVSLPEAIEIGFMAFSSSKELTSVNAPKAIKLDQGAFSYCPKIESISLPETDTLAHSAFWGMHSF